MATLKQGLDYFPLDIDFFNNDKIQLLSARCGLKGENIVLRLLCKIYANGYFCRFGEEEQILLTKQLDPTCTIKLVKNVLHEALERRIFDKEIYEKYCTLTSEGIQRRYFEAITRRKRIELHAQFLLIDCQKSSNVVILSANECIITPNGNIIRQKKRNEIKRKESDCEQVPTHAHSPDIQNIDELSMTDFERFKEWLLYNAPYCADERNFSRYITENQFYELKGKYDGNQIAHIIELIENRKDLRKKYTNFYKTILNWAKIEYGN